MLKKLKYVKIPFAGVVFFSLLLVTSSFYAGAAWIKIKTTPTASVGGKNVFAVEKSNKPQLKFFVMSFCPYGNEAESALKPVADLLGNKVEIKPQYIFDKISGNLEDYCKPRTGDPSQCETYVQNSNGRFKNVAECKAYIEQSYNTCMDEKSYLKIGNNYYTSLHGRVEANQDVREICAWNLAEDKKQWWNFVDNVNKTCNAQNADSCWEEQAKKAGLDTNKITECFNNDAATLIDKEIAETEKYKVSGSPTLIVNEVAFPPENGYTQDGKGNITIGKKTITQDKYRTPDTLKEAICSGFKKAPKECNTVLPEVNSNAAAAGGCGN